ncbi:MAG TPA: inositol monophosphatase [Marmoricola sp.]|nr:inositol monophosphatase [Marmoricola sp.]
MTSTDLGEDAALAGRLVTAAGQLALRMRAEGVEAQQKRSVSDIVTDADHAAEALVLDRLRAERPEDGVVGEEGTAEASTSGRSWHVDPVDGTYNYYAGLDWWCSAIALLDGDDVVLGAVYHPATDVLYVGGPQLPTTANGVRLPRIEDRPLSTSCLTTYLHPPFHGGEVGAAFGAVVSGAATLRMLGSGSMDHTAVARGVMHALVQHSVASWDWWPGSALVRGTGGDARRTTAAGVEWSVAGAPTAVAEIIARLRDG